MGVHTVPVRCGMRSSFTATKKDRVFYCPVTFEWGTKTVFKITGLTWVTFSQAKFFHQCCSTSSTGSRKLKQLHKDNNTFSKISNQCWKNFCHARTFSTDEITFAVHSELESKVPSDKSVAASSTTESITDVQGIEYIPPPPVPPESVELPLNALGEPTFTSLGLGGWSPSGMIQQILEQLHVSLDMPWWLCIVLITVVIRTLVLPLVITSQKNAAKLNNNLPQMQVLQLKMTEARNTGNHYDTARYAQELMEFMKEKDISPFKSMLVPLAQAPVFISVFFGLRKCANLPVESMKEGGIFWFTDLTVVDPFYLLPLITSASLLAAIEVGVDGSAMNAQHGHLMKIFMRALPVVIFPVIMNFPSAILCYWASSNLFSLVQVFVLRIPSVRNYLNIPQLIKHDSSSLPQKKKGVVEGVKESFANMKIAKEIEDRHRYDEMRFMKSGTGPIVRTYKHDPTKPLPKKGAKK